MVMVTSVVSYLFYIWGLFFSAKQNNSILDQLKRCLKCFISFIRKLGILVFLMYSRPMQRTRAFKITLLSRKLSNILFSSFVSSDWSNWHIVCFLPLFLVQKMFSMTTLSSVWENGFLIASREKQALKVRARKQIIPMWGHKWCNEDSFCELSMYRVCSVCFIYYWISSGLVHEIQPVPSPIRDSLGHWT